MSTDQGHLDRYISVLSIGYCDKGSGKFEDYRCQLVTSSRYHYPCLQSFRRSPRQGSTFEGQIAQKPSSPSGALSHKSGPHKATSLAKLK